MNFTDASSSSSSDDERGLINPKEIYLSPLDAKLIAGKLWPLWHFYYRRAGVHHSFSHPSLLNIERDQNLQN